MRNCADCGKPISREAVKCRVCASTKKRVSTLHEILDKNDTAIRELTMGIGSPDAVKKAKSNIRQQTITGIVEAIKMEFNKYLSTAGFVAINRGGLFKHFDQLKEKQEEQCDYLSAGVRCILKRGHKDPHHLLGPIVS